MIKVRWMGEEAFINDSGVWESKNSDFEKRLNNYAGSEEIRGYQPNIPLSMLDLAKENFPGLEIIEAKVPKLGKESKDRIY